MNFLERSASYIFTNYKNHLSSLSIVLPNKRASLFLKDYLSKQIDTAFFTPEFYTIEEVAEKLSGIRIIDNINLIFHLYEVHRSIEGKDAQPFDQFVKWGNVLITDFNDIDQYLIDAKSVYSYLSETKVIDKWTLGEEPLSEFELNYLKFFNSLFEYYQRFQSNLLNKKQGYQGLASRKAVENIKDNSWVKKYHKIIFIGFNALTASEELIIKSLIKAGKAETLWDVDSYYLDNKVQEAGKFLRSYKKNWNLAEFNWVVDDLKDGKKKIDIIGVAKSAGQVKIAGDLIAKNGDNTSAPNSLAIVLAEESLLLPMLNSIPANSSSFNVTMGLGLKNTPFYSLLDAIITMHENADRVKRLHGIEENRFFTRDLFGILKHPYSRYLDQMDDTSFKLSTLLDVLNQSNQVFIKPDSFLNETETANPQTRSFLALIFEHWSSPLQAMKILSGIIHSLRDVFVIREEKTQIDQKLEIEYLFAFSKVITRILNILETYKVEIEIKTLRIVFDNILRMESLPFYGEPLQGIQVMGMLETRALDFEKLILLSVNEGILPSGRNYQSFIPFDIKREFKLPTYREKDAIFAYHFYRLIQKAKDITLIYNTEADELGGGDRSRFITQLIYEMPRYNPGIEITESILSSKVATELPAPIIIPKDDRIMERLILRAEKGFSPSSMNMYIRCPLKFYFIQVMQISEPEEIEESIDAATMGNVVHKALNKLMAPFLNRDLIREKIKINDKEIEREVQLAFNEYFKGGDTAYGKNYLITRVAVNWIKRMLQADIFSKVGNKSYTWWIRNLEERFDSRINIMSGGKNQVVIIKGIIDRIDEQDGQFLVMDYKTGMLTPSHLNIKSWEELELDANYAQAMQLLIYSYLLLKNKPNQTSTSKAGILSVPKPSKGINYLKFDNNPLIIDKAMLVQIEEIISSILTKIFDKELAFTQTEDLDNCKYCPFIKLCIRN